MRMLMGLLLLAALSAGSAETVRPRERERRSERSVERTTERNVREAERRNEARPERERSARESSARREAERRPERERQAQDRWGGHMERDHVGKSEAQMRERLERAKIDAVSSFKDFETADRARREALEAKSREVEVWLKSSQPGDRLSVEHQTNGSLGTRVTADGKVDHSPSKTFLRLERTNARPEGYRIVTGYPIR